MPFSRPLASLAAASLAALALSVPSATAAPVHHQTVVAGASASSAPSALRKQKKLRISYTVTPIKGAYNFDFTVTKKNGTPAPNIRFKLQFQGGGWNDTGIKYTSDAAGHFQYSGCSISSGPMRVYSKATKKHKAVKAVFQPGPC